MRYENSANHRNFIVGTLGIVSKDSSISQFYNVHHDFPITLHIPVACIPYIDELMQETRNSIANALELRLSCTNPSMSCFNVLHGISCLYPYLSALLGCRQSIFDDHERRNILHPQRNFEVANIKTKQKRKRISWFYQIK